MKPSGALWIAVSALLIALYGCREKGTVWSESHNFRNARWEGAEKISFHVDSAAVKGEKSRIAIVTVRYAADATRLTMPLTVEIETPATGYFGVDTLNVDLLPMESRQAANGRLGVFESSDTLIMKETRVEGSVITITPRDPHEEIDGIFSLTLTLKE